MRQSARTDPPPGIPTGIISISCNMDWKVGQWLCTRKRILPQKSVIVMKNILYLILGLSLCAFLFSAGCTQANAPAAAPVSTAVPVTTAPPSYGIQTSSSSLGTILTDTKGMTLYFFASDIPGSGKSTCYGSCVKFWPSFFKENPTIAPALASSDFGVIHRTDGTLQTTYKGWPLYYFSKDTAAGDMKGENVLGNWSVAKPDYTVMYSQQPGAGTFLTDGAGRTLYFRATDLPDTVTCTGTCATNWPAFSSGPLVAPSFLKKTDFTGGKRPDGAIQSMYMDRPLYYFAKDTKPGDMNGQGLLGTWFVANITGYAPPAPAQAPAPALTPTPTPAPTMDYSDSGGGGGY
jgi:predicted lipoprotein with Yx(FWY)xxD motif